MGEALFPQTFLRKSIRVVRGEGCFVFAADGTRYLDAFAGGGAAILGHGVEEVARAVAEQAARFASHRASQADSEVGERFARRLLNLAPRAIREGGRALFTGSGPEAIEAAIKLARQYWIERGEPQRWRIISRQQSYHGATLGALAASGNGRLRDPFAPLLPDRAATTAGARIASCSCYRCPQRLHYPECNVDCADELERFFEREGSNDVAAFLLEPVAGELEGAVAPQDGYLEKIASICRRRGVLLIADEQSTAVGRTGKPFAVEHWNVSPDLIVAGSTITGGYVAAGALLAAAHVVEAVANGSGTLLHAFGPESTAVAAATGNAVLDYCERQGLFERVETAGRELGQALEPLRRMPTVGDLRGIGLLWCIEFVREPSTREPFPPEAQIAYRIHQELLDTSILALPLQGCADGRRGDHLLLAPPFCVTAVMIQMLAAGLEKAIGHFESSRTASMGSVTAAV